MTSLFSKNLPTAASLSDSMDQSAVFMRPKEEIGSTGSVFASEDLKLIYESPAIYEVSGTGKNTSLERYLSYY